MGQDQGSDLMDSGSSPFYYQFPRDTEAQPNQTSHQLSSLLLLVFHSAWDVFLPFLCKILPYFKSTSSNEAALIPLFLNLPVRSWTAEMQSKYQLSSAIALSVIPQTPLLELCEHVLSSGLDHTFLNCRNHFRPPLSPHNYSAVSCA